MYITGSQHWPPIRIIWRTLLKKTNKQKPSGQIAGCELPIFLKFLPQLWGHTGSYPLLVYTVPWAPTLAHRALPYLWVQVRPWEPSYDLRLFVFWVWPELVQPWTIGQQVPGHGRVRSWVHSTGEVSWLPGGGQGAAGPDLSLVNCGSIWWTP